MVISSILLLIFYCALILAYYITWLRIPQFKVLPNKTSLAFSIIISARNEASTITNCLDDIIKQEYASNLFEIIVVNDDSTDKTQQIVEKYITQYNQFDIKLLNSKTINQNGKKAAVTYGIENASYPFIILTDADCNRGEKWLSTINAFVSTTNSKMVYAPVLFKAKTVFEKIQSLEFAGLVAIGGAAIELNNPNMCSAANLIFEKNTFYTVKGYGGSEHIASGDDEYLLHKVCKAFPGEVHFLKNNLATVTTAANKTLAELASQRKRWVSKSTKYENIYITLILVAAYLFNASIIFYIISDFEFGLFLLVCKTIVEGLFLFSVLSFFEHKKYILLLPLAEPFHILYVLFIGIWANMGKYNWKDRNVN